MSKQTPKKLNLYLQLKVWRPDGTIQTISRRRRASFTRALKAVNGRKYELCVTYAPGIKNEGIYTTKKDLLFAYRCFTNKDDVDFILKYNGLNI